MQVQELQNAITRISENQLHTSESQIEKDKLKVFKLTDVMKDVQNKN